MIDTIIKGLKRLNNWIIVQPFFVGKKWRENFGDTHY